MRSMMASVTNLPQKKGGTTRMAFTFAMAAAVKRAVEERGVKVYRKTKSQLCQSFALSFFPTNSSSICFLRLMNRLENLGTQRPIRYLPTVDPGTPASSTNKGFRWSFTSRNTMIVHAGGAMKGTKSTVSADRKITRYHIIAYTFVQFGGKRHPLNANNTLALV